MYLSLYRALVLLKQLIGKNYAGWFANTFPAVSQGRYCICNLVRALLTTHLFFTNNTMDPSMPSFSDWDVFILDLLFSEKQNFSGQCIHTHTYMGSMRHGAPLHPLSASTPGASIWPSPKQMPGPTLSLRDRPFQAHTRRDHLRLTQGARCLVDDTSAPPRHTIAI